MKFFKIFLFIVFSFNYLFSTSIELELKNVEEINGKKVSYIGQSFDVVANVVGGGNDLDSLDIEGLDNFTVSGKSSSSNVLFINGKMSSQVNSIFNVVADEEGDFKIGPAFIEKDGKKIKSNILNINIKKPEAGQHVVSNKNKNVENSEIDTYEVFCKVKVDNDNVVIGQPIILTLSIYNRGKVFKMGLAPFKDSNFLIKEIDNVSNHREKINSHMFNVLEKHFLLTPQQIGLQEINPFKIEFVVPKQERPLRGFFDIGDLMNGFGSMGVENKVALSNVLKINVKPLPKHSSKVDGVGVFNKFEINVDKDEVIVNEPIALKLKIEGKGNLQQISYPKLNLPSFCKFYDSKFTLNENLVNGYNGGEKIFEYILQVGKAGELKIPPQTFTYFDVDLRCYKTLKTNEIELKINPGDDASIAVTENDFSQINDSNLSNDEQKVSFEEDINFISEEFSDVKNNFKFPAWLFIILILIPLLFFNRKAIFLSKKKIEEKYFSGLTRKKTLGNFDKKLDLIIKNEKVQKLHKFYRKYLATKFDVPISLVTEDFIANNLIKENWEEEKIDEFLNYLSNCASFHFASAGNDEDKKLLLDKAKYWFLLLNQ